MELNHFLVTAVAIATVAGIGITAMLWAYLGSGSTKVLFGEAVPLSSSLPEDRAGHKAKEEFNCGCEAFVQGNFRQACDRFTRSLQYLEDFPEAYHNRALAWANLRQDDDAAINLVRAGELYAQQDNQAAIAQIKTQLEAIKARNIDSHHPETISK
jgi:tetratricopeptide (TPR) repeat protein